MCAQTFYKSTHTHTPTYTHKARHVLYTMPLTALKESHFSKTQSVTFGFKTIGWIYGITNDPMEQVLELGWEDVSKFPLDSRFPNEVPNSQLISKPWHDLCLNLCYV